MAWMTKLNDILDEKAHLRVNRAIASERTRRASGEVLKAIFRRLRELGYKIDDPKNLGDRHVRAICHDWHNRGLSPKSMQGYLSHLRIFCGWIGKDGMIKKISDYLPDVPKEQLRVTVSAKKSKSLTEAGIDVKQLLIDAFALDERFGCMLTLQLAFGLRRMEALQLKPWKCDKGHMLSVYKTKGGRPRDVEIATDHQREVLNQIKMRVTKTEPLGWTQRPDGKPASLQYSQRRYCYLAERLGITKELADVTLHGLRAQFAENAAVINGLIPPTLGGTKGQLPREDLVLVRSQVSEKLGHSRIFVTGAYYGSFGREMAVDEPGRAKEAIQACLKMLPIDPPSDIATERLTHLMKLSNELIAIGIFQCDTRHIQTLWETHSQRHACDWLRPSEGSNLAALEAAALSLTRRAEGDQSGTAL